MVDICHVLYGRIALACQREFFYGTLIKIKADLRQVVFPRGFVSYAGLKDVFISHCLRRRSPSSVDTIGLYPKSVFAA